MATAKTVLGEVSASQLGTTMVHEHLILTFGAAKDDMPDEYNVEALAGQVVDQIAKPVRDHGIKTLVDVSPYTLGRDVELQQVVARQLGINVIATTGFYRQRSGNSEYWLYQDEEHFEEFMTRELKEGVSGGINPAKVKCGLIKIGWSSQPGSGDPEPIEVKATRAAARVSGRTGAPIVVHITWPNPARNTGIEAVRMLMEAGADPERIQISHCHSAKGNLAFLLDIVKTGAYAAFDSVFLREHEGDANRERWSAAVGGLIRAGYGHKVLFGTHSLCVSFPKPIWERGTSDRLGQAYHDYGFMFRELLPRLRSGGITDKEIERILVENPARLHCW